jgi:hypothetical protein
MRRRVHSRFRERRGERLDFVDRRAVSARDAQFSLVRLPLIWFPPDHFATMLAPSLRGAYGEVGYTRLREKLAMTAHENESNGTGII